MATPITGDQKDHKDVTKRGVTLHNMPVVTEAQLKDAKDPINVANVSGKREGALITIMKGGKPVLLQAAGDAPTSVWVAVTVAGTDVTPA